MPLGEPMERPHGWLLPLTLFVAGGLLALFHIDSLLRREYREQAVTEAVQAEALLEGFLRQRVSLVNVLKGAIATPVGDGTTRARLHAFARQLENDAPDVRALFILDAKGTITSVFPETAARRDLIGRSLGRTPVHRRAIEESRVRRRATLSGTVELPENGPGLLIYAPLMEADTLHGFVVAAIAYDAAFAGALSGQLRGQFEYRALDADGRVIARSGRFPAEPAEFVRREVMVAATPLLVMEVAVPRFQPLATRLITLVLGGLLILLVVILVVREKAQSLRYAQRSHQLEALSRSLIEANVRLEERARQVSEANKAKSRFLANVSHELRTPLTAIIGYNALAIDGMYGELPRELRVAHDRIATAGQHLLELVDDILDLSRIESGRMAVEPEPVELRAVIESVVGVVEPMVAAKGLNLRAQLADDLPRLVTDPRHLRQILLNLVTNAVKFTERGRVVIRASGTEAGMVIEVQDTGIGIAASDQRRIFEEFEQVRPMGRGDSLQRGTGLGLAIARKLARLIGGELTTRSSPGRGSCFTLSLPPVAPERPAELTPPQPQRRVEMSGGRRAGRAREKRETRAEADTAHRNSLDEATRAD